MKSDEVIRNEIYEKCPELNDLIPNPTIAEEKSYNARIYEKIRHKLFNYLCESIEVDLRERGARERACPSSEEYAAAASLTGNRACTITLDAPTIYKEV